MPSLIEALRFRGINNETELWMRVFAGELREVIGSQDYESLDPNTILLKLHWQNGEKIGYGGGIGLVIIGENKTINSKEIPILFDIRNRCFVWENEGLRDDRPLNNGVYMVFIPDAADSLHPYGADEIVDNNPAVVVKVPQLSARLGSGELGQLGLLE